MSDRPTTSEMIDFRPRVHSMRADVGRLREAREFAARAAAEFGFGDEAQYQFKLAMSEAVTNAIVHGSSSPEDPIRIMAVGEADALVFEVVDTGRFRPRVRRNDDIAESGRGLEFMRLLMDEVDLQPGADGTLLRFSKRRDS